MPLIIIINSLRGGHTLTHTHARTHRYTHTHAHTHTYTHIHTHTHIAILYMKIICYNETEELK